MIGPNETWPEGQVCSIAKDLIEAHAPGYFHAIHVHSPSRVQISGDGLYLAIYIPRVTHAPLAGATKEWFSRSFTLVFDVTAHGIGSGEELHAVLRNALKVLRDIMIVQTEFTNAFEGITQIEVDIDRVESSTSSSLFGQLSISLVDSENLAQAIISDPVNSVSVESHVGALFSRGELKIES